MVPFEDLHKQWTKYRKRLEREIRVLVVDDDPVIRKELDALLYRARISSRTVQSADRVLDLVRRDHYSLVLIADHFPQMKNLELVQQLKAAYPSVDIVVSSWDPPMDLINKAFHYELPDVIEKPLLEPEEAAQRLKAAVVRNVDRRMRTYALQQLRELLKQFDADLQQRTTAQLEQRLTGLKRWMGSFNLVLVVEEQDSDLRYLSENLLVSGFRVETADHLEDALRRLSDSSPGEDSVQLVIFGAPKDGLQLQRLLSSISKADPLVDLMLVTKNPDPVEGIEALQERIAGYVPWPPESPEHQVPQVQQIFNRGRAERLMDNLLAALFWETQSVTSSSPSENFEAFRELVAMRRVPMGSASQVDSASQDAAADASEAMEYLEQVLDHILHPGEEPLTQEPGDDEASEEPEEEEGQERRAFLRVVENQFVRFRSQAAPTSKVAYLGDLSEGGVFIRTGELLPQGKLLEVDVNVEHERQGYLVRCKGEVAWVAKTKKQSFLGPGFGVKFIDPPGDVMILLQRVVQTHSDDE